METIVEELKSQNKRLMEKEEERQRKAELRRIKQREKEKNKSIFRRVFGGK